MKKFRSIAALIAIVLAFNCVPAFAAAQNANPFGLKRTDEDPEVSYDFYLHENGFCTMLDKAALGKAIDALPKLEKITGVVTLEKPVARFIKVEPLNNFEKHVFELHPSNLSYDGIGYSLTQKQYETLLAAVNNAALNPKTQAAYDYGYVYYLAWMNPNRVTQLNMADWTGKENIGYQAGEKIRAEIAGDLRWINVKRGYTRYDPAKVEINKKSGGVHALLEFGGISSSYYHMFVDSKNLYIQYTANGKTENGFKYELSNPNQMNVMKELAKKVAASEDEPEEPLLTPPETGKPVIYLYPEKKTDVTVKLDFKGELVTTIPAYNGGWSVTAEPDGTVTNKSDGEKYPYLFWDGNPDFKSWDFSSGFCVAGSSVGAFLREKLAALGLNAGEAAEFIDYWQPILERNQYTLVNFSTEQYEAVAPLEITPAPDALLRVHMVYKKLEAPVSVPAQKLKTPPVRKGFTVVEWGGTRAK